MGRRSFLLGALSTVSVGLAGCGALGDEEAVEATYEPSGADHLATAVGQLNKAALAVGEFRDREESTGDDRRRAFDASGPRARIRTARRAISAAEEGDTDGADLEAVGRYADGVDGTVDTVANLDVARDLLEAARDALDSDGELDIDAASATLAEAVTASGASRTARDAAATALAAADGDRLTALEAEYDAVRSGADRLLSFVVGVDALAVGYDTYLDGVDDLRTGESRVDAEAFDAARSAFTDAESAFTDAESTFTDAEGQAAADLRSDLGEGDERSRALNRLSGGYVSLVDSRDHLQEAESAIDGGEHDAARAALAAGSEDAGTASERFDSGAAIRAEFGDEFRTARNRATVMQALPEGYAALLDAWDHLTAAEDTLGDGATEAVQSTLDDASGDATTADGTFAAVEGVAPELFGDELATGRSRADALDALAAGYGELLAGRAFLEAGESAFLDGEYDSAASAFADAAAAADRGETTFSAGEPDGDGALFGAEFDRAHRRASVLQSLGEGYGLVVEGRPSASAGQRDMASGEFAAARVQFRFADGRFEDAQATFEDGRTDAGEQFDAEVDRALCRVGHLRDAMAHLVVAAEAGARGDRRALGAESAAGETDLDRVDGC